MSSNSNISKRLRGQYFYYHKSQCEVQAQTVETPEFRGGIAKFYKALIITSKQGPTTGKFSQD